MIRVLSIALAASTVRLALLNAISAQLASPALQQAHFLKHAQWGPIPEREVPHAQLALTEMIVRVYLRRFNHHALQANIHLAPKAFALIARLASNVQQVQPPLHVPQESTIWQLLPLPVNHAL